MPLTREMLQEHAASDSQTDQAFASRDAVLADAGGLLTCYGVGEDSSAALPHAVVELCFTSSVRFLQPGLLLQVRASGLSHRLLLGLAGYLCFTTSVHFLQPSLPLQVRRHDVRQISVTRSCWVAHAGHMRW